MINTECECNPEKQPLLEVVPSQDKVAVGNKIGINKTALPYENRSKRDYRPLR